MSKINWIILLLFITITSCTKPAEFEYPTVFTGDIVDVNDSAALFSGKIANHGELPIIESGFIWGVHASEGIRIKNPETPEDIYTLQTNYTLLPNKTYYVRAYVETETLMSYGRELSFNSGTEEVNIGDWSEVIWDDRGAWCQSVNSSFTLNNITYFLLDKTIYSYNHATNEFSILLSDDIIRNSNFSIVYNDQAYIFSANSFYKFDPNSLSFSRLSVWPNENRNFSSGFLINGNIYVGLGVDAIEGYTKDFWRYNISSDEWQQIANFPGDFRKLAYSFSINSYGYIGGGYNLIDWPYPKMNDLWRYNPEEDQWSNKENLPIENEALNDLKGVSHEGFAYCFYHNELYEYNPIFDLWEKMANLDIDENLCWPHLFTYNNQIFVIEATGYYDVIYFKMWSYAK